MKYRLLGKSGLRVSEVSLGTMTFGDERGWGTDVFKGGVYDPTEAIETFSHGEARHPAPMECAGSPYTKSVTRNGTLGAPLPENV
jgi:hypothetical protein